MAEMDRKYRIDTEENKTFLKGLRDDLLRFGHKFPSPGGSAYYLGDDGTPWTDRGRETYVTCRMAHVYSIGLFLGHEGSGELVDLALKGIQGELHDVKNGGWYAGVASDGQILPNKQCYTHAFVILGACSGILAERAGAEELLREALQVYDLRFWNEEEGLSSDTWDTEFTKLDDYRGLNANMHTVESFLAAADVAQDEKYRIRAGRIIDRIVGWASNNNWRVPEHFTKNWEPDLEHNNDRPDDQFKPYGATPGHGLEWSRLIIQWALSTFKDNPGEAGRYIAAAEKLYERAIADAWDADGAPGIVYTTDWSGKPIVHDRMHWTLAEGISTAAVLWRVTKKERYAEDYAAFMKYLDEKVVDHVHGSWFHQLDRTNHMIGTVWPGKPDLYHALQAVLIPYSTPEISVALAIKAEKSR